MRILVVEDEADIALFLKTGLESEYFAVDVAEDGEKGSFLARTNDYDLVILDKMLPKKDGVSVCEELRSIGKTMPIIILSANSEMNAKVTLLNKGADDYLTKPFSLEELVARVRALLRRPQILTGDVIQIDDLIVDTKRHNVTRSGRTVYLTRKEFMLLELLMRNKGSAVSRGTIMEHVWDMQADPFSNTIESHVLNLRKKLNGKGKKQLIHTVPGIGYKVDIED